MTGRSNLLSFEGDVSALQLYNLNGRHVFAGRSSMLPTAEVSRVWLVSPMHARWARSEPRSVKYAVKGAGASDFPEAANERTEERERALADRESADRETFHTRAMRLTVQVSIGKLAPIYWSSAEVEESVEA